MKKLLLALASLLFISSCSDKKAEEGDLTILFTTDVHGMVLPYNFLTNSEASVSMAQVYTCIEELKSNNENYILLDAGDLGEGQPSTYYYNFVEKGKEHVLGKTINFLGYDALGIGENEIQFGEDIYKRAMPHWYKAPIVCGNVYEMATGETIFKPYTIINKGGFKVAVLGLTSPEIYNRLSPITMGTIVFDDLDKAAKYWVNAIKNDEEPDLIVGLLHTNANDAKLLIQEVEGLDLVLCGQDHIGVIDYANDPSFKKVSILQPLPRCQELGKAKIHFKRNEEGGIDKEINVERIDLSKVTPSQAYISEFKSEIKVINDYLDEPLGITAEELDPVDALIGPSPIMNIIHDMQRWNTGVKISITNFVSTYNKVPSGNLSTRDLFNLYRFENRRWTVKMTGKEIKDLLEYSYDNQYATYEESTGYPYLIAYELDTIGNVKINNFGPILKTAQYNYLSAAGIDYVIDLTKPAGEKVSILALSESGEEFNLEETYQVVMPDHLAVGNLTKNALKWDNMNIGPHMISSHEVDIRRTFADYIREHSPIELNKKSDWKVIPEDFYRVTAPKEKDFLSKYLK